MFLYLKKILQNIFVNKNNLYSDMVLLNKINTLKNIETLYTKKYTKTTIPTPTGDIVKDIKLYKEILKYDIYHEYLPTHCYRYVSHMNNVQNWLTDNKKYLDNEILYFKEWLDTIRLLLIKFDQEKINIGDGNHYSNFVKIENYINDIKETVEIIYSTVDI